MKIVFAASEAVPFAKTGGLGDVAGALTSALSKVSGNEVFLFLPYYSRIKNNPVIMTKQLLSFQIKLAWRNQAVNVYEYIGKNTDKRIYFIDNKYYFERDNEYGYYDDGERFAYFSKAVLEAVYLLDLAPHIIHCNDWQTALIPVFLAAFYGKKLANTKTVFTIHNIEYQGKCDPYFLNDTLGLSEKYREILTHNDRINFVKGAVISADALTTVSETYAEQIKHPYFAHGLSSVIQKNSFKLKGITNGIDVEEYDPLKDNNIVHNYGINDYRTGKKNNKAKLQEKLDLDIRKDVALIGMVSRIVDHKGFELVCDAVDELMMWDIQLVILGTGDDFFEKKLLKAASRHKKKFSLNLCFDPKLASQIYASSDIFLMPSKSEPCGLSQLVAMRYGAIPVVNETGGLKDTVPAFNGCQTGRGFTFQSFCTKDMVDALKRCHSVYTNDKSAWNMIVKNAMCYDPSWDKPTLDYMEVYRSLFISN